MSKPLLIVDSYLDPEGGTRNFQPVLANIATTVIRPAFADYELTPHDFSAMIITGSAASVAVDVPEWVPKLLLLIRATLAARRPLLGVCFGHQALAETLNPGCVRLSGTPEIGWYDITHSGADSLFQGVSSPFRTFVSHKDEVLAGAGMEVLASTDDCRVHAFRVHDRCAWGVQFHSEMGLQEATQLVHRRAEKHPEFGLEPEKILERSVDSSALLQTLVGNFLEHVRPNDS